VQLGGIMAGRRVDEVPDNVFRVSGRINSTWGGGLTDMVRSRRMLEVIERDRLFDQAASTGAWLLAELAELGARFPGLVMNVRGRGLMLACELDVPAPAVARRALVEQRLVTNATSPDTLRLLPPLIIKGDEIEDALQRLAAALEG